jgi:hypothetical protein
MDTPATVVLIDDEARVVRGRVRRPQRDGSRVDTAANGQRVWRTSAPSAGLRLSRPYANSTPSIKAMRQSPRVSANVRAGREACRSL